MGKVCYGSATTAAAGLQMFGQGEWNAERHGRELWLWRKLRLAVGTSTGKIAAQVLTKGSAGDAAQVPTLLGRIQGSIASVTADGAYDGEPVYRPARSSSAICHRR
jgi:hypothetical protein